MARSDDRMLRRVARAYERGRGTGAVRRVAPLALLLIGVPLVAGSDHMWAGLGALLAAAAAVAIWRGGVAGRAARAGLLAGVLPLVSPIAVGAIGHRCTGCPFPASLPLCIAVCVAAGATAGAMLGLLAVREPRRLAFTGTAVGFAALAGSLGCIFAGSSGLVGMAIGLALGGAAPLLAAARN